MNKIDVQEKVSLQTFGRPVGVVRMHATTMFAGAGNLGPTIDTNSKSSLGKLSLTHVQDGIHVLFVTKHGAKTEGFIPVGNIVSIEYLPN